MYLLVNICPWFQLGMESIFPSFLSSSAHLAFLVYYYDLMDSLSFSRISHILAGCISSLGGNNCILVCAVFNLQLMPGTKLVLPYRAVILKRELVFETVNTRGYCNPPQWLLLFSLLSRMYVPVGKTTVYGKGALFCATCPASRTVI